MDVESYRGAENVNHLSEENTTDRYYGGRGRSTGGGYSLYYGSKHATSTDKMADNKSRDNTEDSRSVASLDSTGKRKSFRRLLSRFAEKTSMTGVPYISNAKFWWAKVIWTVMLMAAIGVLTLHMWYLVDQYTDWPIQTKISLGFETLKFPEITICNTNVMHKGRFDKYNGANELKALVRALQPEILVPDQFDSNYDPYATEAPPVNEPQNRRKRFVDEYESFNRSQYKSDADANARDLKSQDDSDYTEKVDPQTVIDDLFVELYMDINKFERSRLGHNISDMLLSCTFNGRECVDRMFRLHQTSEYGNCWSIRSDNFNVKSSGPSAGLTLVLFLEVGEYLKGITTGYGARMQVHEQSTYPFPAEEGLYLSASMETDIGLRMVAIGRRGGKYGDCDDGVSFNSDYDLKYTRRACQAACEISKVIEVCKCFDDESEELAQRMIEDVRPCRSNTEVRCMVNIQKQFESQKLDCSCDNPCNEVQYTKSVSQRQWPADDYAMVLLESICDKDKSVCASLRDDLSVISKNFLKLNIYYEDLNYENITEEPEIELQQFLSDVGGAIGLWIGLSVLSLCELVQLFVELCDYGIHKTVKERRKERKKRRKEQKRLAKATNQTFSTKNENLQWPDTNFENEQNSLRGGLYFSHPGSDAIENGRYREDDKYHYYSSARR